MSFENWDRFVNDTIALLNDGKNASERNGSKRRRTGKQHRRIEEVGGSLRGSDKARPELQHQTE